MSKSKAYTDPGMVWVICGLCGKRYRRKDTVEVSQEYHLQNGLVVCKWDYDQFNPQSAPFKIKEKVIHNPEGLRPDGNPIYIDVPTDDRVPSAPRNLQLTPDTLNPYLMLIWDGPEDPGTSQIIGYVIQRAEPQLAYYFTIDTTNTTYQTYTDTTMDFSREYSYRVAAINSAGVGVYSSDAFWPTPLAPWSDINYLTPSQNNETLTTSSGLAIRLNHVEVGVL